MSCVIFQLIWARFIRGKFFVGVEDFWIKVIRLDNGCVVLE